MQDAVPRNLRTAERFLLAPPLAAQFGAAAVSVCDISAKGARFKHVRPLETGTKSLLRVPVDGRSVSLEAVIVWTQAEVSGFTSGVRTYGPPEVMGPLLAQLHATHRSARIEELRSTDRFNIAPPLAGVFAGRAVTIADLSARGARIDGSFPPGMAGVLHFRVPGSQLEAAVTGQVVWSSANKTGLFINEKPELLRLAIGQLCETNRAALDTKSLPLKLRILRARARQLAPAVGDADAEQFVLIHGVREELRLNPEEALHWYRRARLVINDPATRAAAPAIADHPDALAVWEYLDRSVDQAVVGRAFALPGG
ncbi:MAG TPA: PilZ domain-containing protein [Thermoanaerobaculia bacterium]|nr:PilZ domain-containing protein [Thermoanaerobaculia bacterium]